MAMAIGLNQIHNVVRTYQRALRLLPFTRRSAEQAGHMEENLTSISPDVHGLDTINPVNEV
jgi:hypothetical protein